MAPRITDMPIGMLRQRAIEFLTEREYNREGEMTFIDSLATDTRRTYFTVKSEVYWKYFNETSNPTSGLPLLPKEYAAALRLMMDSYTVTVMDRLLKNNIMHTDGVGARRGQRFVPNSRLTAENVREIKVAYGMQQEKVSSIADRYCVSNQAVRDLLKGRTWTSVRAEPEVERMVEYRLKSGRQARNTANMAAIAPRVRDGIMEMLADGRSTQTDIAKTFSVSQSTVSRLYKRMKGGRR